MIGVFPAAILGFALGQSSPSPTGDAAAEAGGR